MKIKLIIAMLLLQLSIYPDDIRIQEVDNYNWEATAVINNTNTYLYFDFTSSNQSVKVIEKDLFLNIISENAFKYKLFFDEYPRHIYIYDTDIEEPIYSIEYFEGNYILKMNQISANPKTLISFDSVKNNYVRLFMQGVLNYDRVRLRTAPNLEAKQIDSLMKGDVVKILNRSDYQMKINEMNSFWFKVQTQSGLVGWTYGYFMELGKVINSNNTLNTFIFQKFVNLDQGSNQRFYFYKNNKLVSDSGWIKNNQIYLFENQNRLVSLSDNYRDWVSNQNTNFEAPPLIYIFDFSGELINEIEINNMILYINRIKDSSLFYQVVENGLDSNQIWSNKCIIYNHDGIIVNETIFNDSDSIFEFEYMGKQYRIKLN
ncbi:SH3 domain-containing protein [Spirochaeta isovalerica]|uniref:SH3b domain-containing protein n=1 Tax=Spirochaeta isovalerica TaxID=150 RepID=A0A841RGY9_9SPIO|nr:SH3 domain-containing protein [Spirochaeta isovalerica]MBB6482280.1 hypothetical protein [Spirochaeta isovalerica]